MEETSNRRECTRVPAVVEVEAKAPALPAVRCRTRDVSLKGVFLASPDRYPKGTRCQLQLVFPGEPEPLAVSIKGKVVRMEEEGMGIEFMGLDLIAYDQLCQLLMEHSEEPEALAGEMAARAPEEVAAQAPAPETPST